MTRCFSSAIFCDDIRLERGSKHSLMGCYAGELILDSLPSVLPKLCVQVSVTWPVEEPCKWANVRAKLGDDLIAELKVTNDDIQRVIEAVDRVEISDVTLMSFATQLVFSPLPIAHETELKITVETDEGEMKAGRLKIRARKETDHPF